MPKTISPSALHALMAGEAPHAVLDVREPMEFHEEQIFWTTNLPRGSIEFRVGALVPARATPIVLVDEGGPRAGWAAGTLERLGYSAVSLLAGGLPAWKREGFPTASGTNVPSKDFGERVHVEEGVPEIGAQELHALLGAPAPPRILDARTEAEFERFAIPGGRSLPGGELILHAWDLMRDAATPLIVNCAGRTRSIIGAQTLRRLGVAHARALKNGGMGFMLAGLPLERGRPSEIPEPSPRSRAHAEELAARLAAEEGIRSVSPGELSALQGRADRETLYLLDVRLAPEYRAGHIPGAISIPGGQAVQRTDEVVAVRAASVVTCCSANARATMAAYWLARMGLRVRVLRGGVPAWRAAPGRSPGEARPLLGGEAVLLDVGTSRAFREGHLPGARWAPRAWLEERAAEWIPGKRAAVLVACGDGARSALAAHTLIGMGYAGASFLEGGKRAWGEAGLPLEAGSQGIEDDPKDVPLKPYEVGREAMEAYLSWEENLGRKHRPGGA